MSTSGKVAKRTARGRFAGSRTSSRAPAGRKPSPAIMPPRVETTEPSPAPRAESAEATPLPPSPHTTIFRQTLAGSSNTRKGKAPERYDHLDEMTRQIYDAFARAETAYEALCQHQEQQGEDIEMIDAIAVENYNKLSDEISDFRTKVTNKETVDQLQTKWLLDECRQFGATVETDTLRLQQDIGVKGYVYSSVRNGSG